MVRRQTPKLSKSLITLFLLLGVLLMGGGGVWAAMVADFVGRAERAPGVVVDLERSGTGSDVSFRPVVTYKVPDSPGTLTLVGQTATSPPAFAVGEVVQVLFDPDSPTTARIDAPFALWGGPLILCAVGGVFFLVGLGGGLARSRSNRPDTPEPAKPRPDKPRRGRPRRFAGGNRNDGRDGGDDGGDDGGGGGDGGD